MKVDTQPVARIKDPFERAKAASEAQADAFKLIQELAQLRQGAIRELAAKYGVAATAEMFEISRQSVYRILGGEAAGPVKDRYVPRPLPESHPQNPR